MLPRITLVTPSFNQASFLETALRSVLAQNYPDLEYIVMDGGSTDGSVEILRRYQEHFAYWTSEPDGGQSDALNRGFARATGTVLGWLNSDDLLLPEALHAVGAYFAAHPECHFLTGDGVFVNADDTREVFVAQGAAYTFNDLLHYYADNYLPQPAVFFSPEAFQRAGGLDTSLHYVMDVDLWLRMRRNFALHYLPRRLAKMRLHDMAKSQHQGQAASRAVVQVTQRYWTSVGFLQRVRIFFGLRRMLAREACQFGLIRASRNDLGAGWRALRDALGWDPFILASPVAQRLCARLCLPGSLRRRLLRVP